MSPRARAALAAAPAVILLGASRAAAMAASGAPDAAASRARAHEILREQRFHGSGVPRPFARPLHWLGEQLAPLLDRLRGLGGDVPGGPPVLWTLLAIAVLLAGAWLGRHAIRRAGLAPGAAAAAAARRESPQELERQAAAAERDGHWDVAVRLRFRAGLLRLDAGGVLAYRPSLTTGEVAAAVGSPAFAALGARFDAIVYGGEPATADDAEAARRGWQSVLAEAAPAGSAP